MKKGEVDLIMLRVGTTEGDSMRMKIFRDGTITRRGAGGLPPVTIEATSYKWKPEVFAKLIDDLEPLITDDPKEYKEEAPNETVRYSVSFFGGSVNGETNDEAEWSKATGLTFIYDSESGYESKLVDLIDWAAAEALELTNEWYFDVMMNVTQGLESPVIPNGTAVSYPETDEEFPEQLDRYVNQLQRSPREWSIASFYEGKKYLMPDGREVTLIFEIHLDKTWTLHADDGLPDEVSNA